MRILTLFLTSVVLLTFKVQGQTTPKINDKQLGCATPMRAHTFDNPFKAIAEAITKDQKSKRFRVTWGDTLGSGWDNGTMLYNRENHTLKYFDVGGAGEAGEEYYQKQYLFTGVTDKTFTSLLKTYNNQNQIEKFFPFGFIDLLPKHGYRKYKIKDIKRGF